VLTRAFPNLTVIDIGSIIRQIQSVIDQVIAAVEFLFLFTLVSGVLVLYAALVGSQDERIRESGLLRALGATRTRILTLICVEAGLIGLIGGVLGIVGGHLVAAGGSAYMNRLLGQSIPWFATDRYELLYLAGVVLIAVLAGLVPALKAYRTPVATNLVAA
jgi:putative ABC transport system permease protein